MDYSAYYAQQPQQQQQQLVPSFVDPNATAAPTATTGFIDHHVAAASSVHHQQQHHAPQQFALPPFQATTTATILPHHHHHPYQQQQQSSGGSNAASFNSTSVMMMPQIQQHPSLVTAAATQQQQQQMPQYATLTSPQQMHQPTPASLSHSLSHEGAAQFTPGALWPAMFPMDPTGASSSSAPSSSVVTTSQPGRNEIPSSNDVQAVSFSLEGSTPHLAEFGPASMSLHNLSTTNAVSTTQTMNNTVATVGPSIKEHSSSHDSNSYSPASDDEALRSNLFVCMLPPTATDAILMQLFEPYGEIESAKVMLNIHTGQSRGIAFVKFVNSADAQRAMTALDGSMLFQQKITVRVANAKAAYCPGTATKKTFIRNVPASVSKAELQQYFSQFGTVTEISILPDAAATSALGSHAMATPHDMQQRMIVFVSFAAKESAKLAAEKVHTSLPFAACNGVPLLAKVAEDTMRRNERLSKRTTDHSTGSSGSHGGGSHSLTSLSSLAAVTSSQQQQHIPANAHLIFHPNSLPTTATSTSAPLPPQQQQQQQPVYYVQHHHHHHQQQQHPQSAPLVSHGHGTLNTTHLNYAAAPTTTAHHHHPQQQASPSSYPSAQQQTHWYPQQQQQQQQQSPEQQVQYVYWKSHPDAATTTHHQPPPPQQHQQPQQPHYQQTATAPQTHYGAATLPPPPPPQQQQQTQQPYPQYYPAQQQQQPPTTVYHPSQHQQHQQQQTTSYQTGTAATYPPQHHYSHGGY